MKRKRGFTLYEIMIVVGILGILIGIAIPSLTPAVQFSQKNLTNTMHKIGVNAIDLWIKANYDPVQRPDNFNSKNSQGKAVFEYITDQEFFRQTNLKVEDVPSGTTTKKWVVEHPKQKDQVYITFSGGVLTTSYINEVSVAPVITVSYVPFDFTKSNYSQRKELNYIVGYVTGTYEVSEYAEVKSN